MIYLTEGIVLRPIKYGETSVVVKIFTEKFGLQSYMVNGVRGSSKKSSAHLYQPASLVEMQVYYQELKDLQRVKECSWAVVYDHIFTDVTRNAVALFMTELLTHSLNQPEENPALFQFCKNSFISLDKSNVSEAANFPLYFAVHLCRHLGLGIQNNYSAERSVLDIKEGNFTSSASSSELLGSSEHGGIISQLLRIDPAGLGQIRLHRKTRMAILKELEQYYLWHFPGFSPLKTPDVLSEIL